MTEPGGRAAGDRAALYICYFPVQEPLVQTQVLPYLRELARRGYRMHLLTFEDRAASPGERDGIRESLARSSITWHALRYHARPSLPATLYDIAVGTVKAARISMTHAVKAIHARSHVAAAMALLLKWLLGCRFLFDVRGLLAEEYADAGHWRRGGLKYRLTKGMERVFFRRADAVVVLTETIKEDLRNRLEGKVTVIPCCVDTDAFARSPAQRDAVRAEMGWTSRRVLLYVGKLGGWYLPEEMARFFAIARRMDDRLFLQVLTQSDPLLARGCLERARVAPDHYSVSFVAPQRLPEVMAAADAGLSFIRPCYSKRASSPTKIAEYLASGLPVLTNSGIGDVDRVLDGRGIGVVLSEFSEEEYRWGAQRLFALMDDSAAPGRCTAVAADELSLDRVGAPRYAAVYERLFEGAEVKKPQGVGGSASGSGA